MKRLLLLVLTLALMMSCIGSLAEEPVTLRIAAYMAFNEEDGFLSDPTTKWIEDQLNVKLEVTHTREGDWATNLASSMAANDLPDIFILSGVSRDLPKLLDAEQVLCIDDYLSYATKSTEIPAIKAMMEANRKYSPDGKLYTWGMCMGDWSDGTKPTAGSYIRWDLYSKLGYPEIKNRDQLLDTLEQMVKLEPKTENGLPTYALGAWFGDGQFWALYNISCLLTQSEGVVPVSSGFTFAINAKDSTPVGYNTLTNTESNLWQAVDFYAEAYRRGLLDPDSFTMTQQMWQDKISAGQYMYCIWGWEATDANSDYYKNEGNTKQFLSLPSMNGEIEARISTQFSGERKYCISSATKHPEKCVELLDMLSTYEGSLVMINGPEGITWTRNENNEIVPKPEYIAADRENDVYRNANGNYIWNHTMGFCNGAFWEEGNTYIDLWQFSPEAQAKNMTPTLQDFLNYYDVSTQLEAYQQQTKVITEKNFYVAPTMDDEMTMYVSNLSNYFYKNVFEMITKPTKEDYEQAKAEFIAGTVKYRVDEVYDFFYRAALEQKESMESLASYFK